MAMRCAPLALSDTQLEALRLVAAATPPEWRGALLQLLAGYCAGEPPDDTAFCAALTSALDALDRRSERLHDSCVNAVAT